MSNLNPSQFGSQVPGDRFNDTDPNKAPDYVPTGLAMKQVGPRVFSYDLGGGDEVPRWHIEGFKRLWGKEYDSKFGVIEPYAPDAEDFKEMGPALKEGPVPKIERRRRGR